MFNKIYDKLKRNILENYKFYLIILVLIFIYFYKLPFVIYRPGGVVPLSDRVEISNGYKSAGSFSMSYVSMMKGNIVFTLLSFALPNWDLIATDKITLENESVDESITRDKILLKQGLDNAIFASFKEAGKEINVTSVKEEIIYITKDAKTDLKLGDIIISINEKEFNNLEEIQKYINTLQLNDTVYFKVLRNDKEITCKANVYEIENSLKIGISIIDKYEYTTNPEVNIKFKDSESGSSGGLMTSLQIYNELVEEDITKGRKIVGTGTIDMEGNVGEIGGIKYKLLGAEKNKADIFLCPIENYEEANEVKEKNNLKLKLIPVATLNEAINELKK